MATEHKPANRHEVGDALDWRQVKHFDRAAKDLHSERLQQATSCTKFRRLRRPI